MKNDWEFDAHEAYMNRLSAVSGIPLVNSIVDENLLWGLRRLSRSDVEKLQADAEMDHDLSDRWLNRLQNGYDREKSQIAIEIEEIFSDVPCATQINDTGQEDAA